MIVPKLISLSGWKGLGKDTFADHLVDAYGYSKIAFADPLRSRVASWLSWPDYAPDDLPSYIRELVDACIDDLGDMSGGEYVRTKPYSDSLRKLLQLAGTEYYRAKDRTYWLKSMHLDPDIHYVVSDRRFDSETEFSLMMGAACWRINREGHITGDLHASEVRIPHLYNHVIIENEWGRQDKIPALCKHYLELTAKFSGVVTLEV